MSSATNQTYPLQGKIALITGCTGGLGGATARAFARNGCSIAVHHSSARSKAKADELVAELVKLAPGVKAAAFEADLSTYENARKLYDEVAEQFGHPDILFSNHGVTGKTIGPRGDAQDISPEAFEENWRLNCGSAYVLAQKSLPHMQEQKWGRIIFTSSVAAGTGGVIGPHYASAKSALHGLIHWLSLRYCKEGILTNGVAPALVGGTGMMSNAPPGAQNMVPIGRFGQPEEFASIVLMLATNGYMTNKIIVADGGMTNGGL